MVFERGELLDGREHVTKLIVATRNQKVQSSIPSTGQV